MRWEDQELNHAVPDNRFPEILAAWLSLFLHAEKSQGQYVRINQSKLDELIRTGECPQAFGARIDRLCLYARLTCGLGPGGDHSPALGITNFFKNSGGDSGSLYAVLYLSPNNDWLKMMIIAAPPPK
jgi:hypothetical protein